MAGVRGERLVYVYGIRGAGKTMFCTLLGCDATVGFISTKGHEDRTIEDCPWPACRDFDGARIWPGEWTPEGTARHHDYSQKDAYRALASIPPEATIARISGDGFNGATRGMDEDEKRRFLFDVQAWLLQRYDYVVHCMGPPFEPGLSGRVIALATPARVIEERARGPQWGGRAPYERAVFLEEARRMAWTKGQFWQSCPVDSFWWDEVEARWVPIDQWLRAEMQRMVPWYHYFDIGGIPNGTTVGLNGAGKWLALRKLLPPDLKGKRILDVGANAGYNSFAAALEGATVLAVESSDHYADQFEFVEQCGPYPAATSARVKLDRRAVQLLSLRHEQFDAALLSAVHYHLARSTVPPYREPKHAYPLDIPAPLAVVLEDLRVSTDQIIVATNLAHAEREENPYEDAKAEWVENALSQTGYTDIETVDGYGHSKVTTARGRPWWRGPETLSLMLGWRCNASCVMCWQAASRRNKTMLQDELSLVTIQSLLTQYGASLLDLELCSFGEPTAHPGFADIARAVVDSGIEWRNVNLITNGSDFESLLPLCTVPGLLTFSMDAADQVMYESIRRGLDFYTITRNIAMAVAAPERHERRKIGINMVVFEKNAEHVFEMASWAAAVELDYLAVLRGANLLMTDVPDDGLRGDDPRIVDQLARAREMFPQLELLDYFTVSDGDVQPPSDGHCTLPWRALDVGPDGVAHPCCRTHRLALDGDDPWQHATMQALRGQLLSGALDEERFSECATCPMRYGP